MICNINICNIFKTILSLCENIYLKKYLERILHINHFEIPLFLNNLTHPLVASWYLLPMSSHSDHWWKYLKHSQIITIPTCVYQGSHTSQMSKSKGISRVIKGSTAHFQGYFWKTILTLLYVNKISSNFSHLFQDFFFLVYATF